MRLCCRICGKNFYYEAGMSRSACFDCKPSKLNSLIPAILVDYGGGLTYEDLVKKYNISGSLVKSFVRTYGEPRIAAHIFSRPVVNLNGEFFDGWLAGDGSLDGNGGFAASASFSSSKLTYVQYIRNRLAQMGLVVSDVKERFKDIKTRSGITRARYFKIYTDSHPVLTVQYRRWYPGGKKVLPLDVNPTPEVLLQWYLGDGATQKGYCTIINCDFSYESLFLFYQKLFPVFSDKVSLWRSPTRKQVNIRFGVGVVRKFLDYIGECPVVEYSYKWINKNYG